MRQRYLIFSLSFTLVHYLKINGRWVHLRICQTCGKMLCCDSSEHQHARHHYETTGHAVISSAELGEQWLWCFVDEQQKEY